jgi:hypothetical protein
VLDDRPIVIVEPHPDDAYLSLGASIRTWTGDGRRVHVVTVYSADARRAEEARAWAAAAGASWSGLGHRWAEVSGLTTPEAVPALPRPLLTPDLLADDRVRIWPLGIGHPEHAEVASHAEAEDLRYIDTPYQLDPSHQRALGRALVGRSVAWWMAAPSAKWPDRVHFPSQEALFDLITRERLGAVAEVVVA